MEAAGRRLLRQQTAMYTDLISLCTAVTGSIKQAIAQMEVNRIGIVLVVDSERRLLGTVTDGDVRRALLANLPLDEPVNTLLERKAGTRYSQPITAPEDADRKTLLETMRYHNILHLPLVDREQRVVALVAMEEFLAGTTPPMEAVIMAGGQGVRLRPLTDEMPKPMLPVGDQPLMERTLEQLRSAGIKRVNVTVHHKSDKITEYFGDGRAFGVDISYVNEERPLGTAGALALMDPPQETMLVINGDILTQVDFRTMLAYHREQHSDLTVGVLRQDLQVPYGVLECEGANVQNFSEKPVLSFLVNAGIYLLEPSVHGFIPFGQRFDMTDLIQRLLEEDRRVTAFPISEYWLDVGQLADYKRAMEDVKNWNTTL